MKHIVSSPQPFDPEEFFRWASSVARNPASSEAELRSAVSRAYYAVFLTARDALFGGADAPELTAAMRGRLRKRYSTNMRSSRGPGSHDIVLAAASEAGIAAKMIVGLQQLVQLETARIMADYYRIPANYNQEVFRVVSWQQCARDSLAMAAIVLPSVRRLPRFRSVVRI